MRQNEFPAEDVRNTLWQIIDMGRSKGEPGVWVDYVVAFLTKDQLRHVFVADRLVDDYVAFRMHSGRAFKPMDDIRATLKRIAEHGKQPGIEVDWIAEVDGPLIKIAVIEVRISAEEIQQLVVAARAIDEKVIAANGERILAEAKTRERETKAKAARAEKAKK